MDENVQKFINLTTKIFYFLEIDFHYRVTLTEIKNQDYYPDSEAVVRYLGSKVGIEVFWDFASSIIGVAFIELKNGKFPENQATEAKIINIYSLTSYLSQGKENMLLLKNIEDITVSKIKNREKIVNEKMKGILENLAEAVKKYAKPILFGDTSIFPIIQMYQMKLIQQ